MPSRPLSLSPGERRLIRLHKSEVTVDSQLRMADDSHADVISVRIYPYDGTVLKVQQDEHNVLIHVKKKEVSNG